MENNGTDPNAGIPDGGSQGIPDSGNPGGNPSSNNGTPDGQGGQPTDERETELARLRENNRALNKALIEARRGGRNGQQQNGQQGDPDTSSPEYQYATAIRLATADLRGKLEDVYDLYPEVPQQVIAQIRKNPWAYASQQSYFAGDWETAALEIEGYILDQAESSAGQGADPNPKPTPAQINGNPAPTPANPDADPGSDEDENDWTMPIDKLEKKARKLQAKQSQTS